MARDTVVVFLVKESAAADSEHNSPSHPRPRAGGVSRTNSNNPKAEIITNSSVGALLAKEGIAFRLVADGDTATIKTILFEGFGTKHAGIYAGWKDVENTGYCIAGRFFYPGDALFDPEKEVEILALPVAGPWVKISEAVDYALRIKPKVCFPVHEAMLRAAGSAHRIPAQVLPTVGIEFRIPEENKEMIFK